MKKPAGLVPPNLASTLDVRDPAGDL